MWGAPRERRSLVKKKKKGKKKRAVTQGRQCLHEWEGKKEEELLRFSRPSPLLPPVRVKEKKKKKKKKRKDKGWNSSSYF